MPQVDVLGSYDQVAADEWDELVADGSPFLEHAFLAGLERTGCATPATGWIPRPILVRDDEGRLVAGAPGWVKTHSMGEFVYDHGWADAARRARIPYYPKLVLGVPFTPVTGSRLLIHPDADPKRWRPILLAGVQAALKGCHGLHVLFNEAGEASWLEEQGAFLRLQYQFHWLNEGYGSFDDWLGRFRSKDRNKIRRERREAARLGFEARVGATAAELDTLHRFYENTCRQFGPWGRVYLSRAFYRYLGEVWNHRLQVVLARDGSEIVAGALNVTKGDRLYGRYWGCSEAHPFLHFEVCYYQAVDWCVAHGLAAFEPGHGGGHKYKRGFEPTLTHSNHWFPDRRLHEGLERYVSEEAAHVRADADALRARSPLKP